MLPMYYFHMLLRCCSLMQDITFKTMLCMICKSVIVIEVQLTNLEKAFIKYLNT